MLDSLRNAAQTRVVKGLLALLILSFMVWGGQTLMVPNTPNAVVTVGDVKVSASDFRLAYERQVALLSRQLGTPLSRQQAQASGSRTRSTPSSSRVLHSTSSLPT